MNYNEYFYTNQKRFAYRRDRCTGASMQLLYGILKKDSNYEK